MELRQLRHFLAVIEHRQFGRAATAVNLTQQALSHSISTLERDLSVKLFERGAFGAEPTPAGRILERRARLILAEAKFASAEMSAYLGGAEGQVCIGVSQNFATQLLPKALQLFQRSKPRVQVATVVGTSAKILDLAVSGQIDFAVTSPLGGVQSYLELEHERLGRRYLHDPSYLVMRAGHPLAVRGNVEFAGLGEYPWFLPETFPYLWERVFRAIQDANGRLPRHVVKTDSVTFVRAQLLQSDFIALLGREVVHFELIGGLLVSKHLPSLLRPVEAFVSCRSRAQLQPAAATFIQCFESSMAWLEEEGIGEASQEA